MKFGTFFNFWIVEILGNDFGFDGGVGEEGCGGIDELIWKDQSFRLYVI